jgi:hypothetical protein
MPQEPPDMPQDLPHDADEYVSYADQLEEKESGRRKKGDSDSGDTDNSGDEGSAGDAARRNMTAEEIIQEEEVKDSWLEKLKLIFIAPFSHIIPGTVSYTAESDLSKKAFFLRVGLYNRQIEPTDIADPDLVKRLEERHQERRQRFDLGLSVPLEYLRPKPKAPAAAAPTSAAPGLGASAAEGGTDTAGGSDGTQVQASATNPSEAQKQKSIFRNTSIEERALMATGSTLAEAKAEIDEYTTPEEFLQEMEQAEAFGHIVQPTDNMEFQQAFNYVASQTGQSVTETLRKALSFTDRDGKQDSTPSFPNLDKA